MNRRQFIQGCSATLSLAALRPNLLWAVEDSPKKDIFVQVFLRGGCDFLNLIGPASNRIYADARPAQLRVEEGGANKGLHLGSLQNEPLFLHPRAQALFELYQSKQLAIVEATGLRNGTRSHFDAQELIEKGVEEKKDMREGWLARYLQNQEHGGLIPALASGKTMPLSFLGSNKALALGSAKEFELKTDPRLFGLLRSLYSQGDTALDASARRLLKHIEQVQSKLPREANGKVADYQPKASYPEEWYARNFSQKLQNLAQLIKMDVGLSVATLDFHGWDTHENQAASFGNLIETLSRGLAAFYNDLSAYQARLNIVVLSEFGRRLKANKSGGTDHGFGGAMLLLGNKLRGGKLYGQWPGLDNQALDKGVDLAVTSDYRQVFGEVFEASMQTESSILFPEFNKGKTLGFI